MQNRQALLAAQEIVARRFAGDRGIAPNAQNVILNLKGKAAGDTKAVERFDLCRRCPADDRPNGHTRPNQRRGFPLNHPHIFGDRHVGARFKTHIQMLPLGQFQTSLGKMCQRL